MKPETTVTTTRKIKVLIRNAKNKLGSIQTILFVLWVTFSLYFLIGARSQQIMVNESVKQTEILLRIESLLTMERITPTDSIRSSTNEEMTYE